MDLGDVLGSIVIFIIRLFCVLCAILKYDLWESFIMLSCIDSVFAVHIFRQVIPTIILLISAFLFNKLRRFSLSSHISSSGFFGLDKALFLVFFLFAFAIISHTYIIVSAVVVLLAFILPSSVVSLSFLAVLTAYLLDLFSDPRFYTSLLVFVQSQGFGQVSMSIMLLDDISPQISPLALASYLLMALVIILRYVFPSIVTSSFLLDCFLAMHL